MGKITVSILIKILLALTLSVPAFAQSSDGSMSGPRRQLSVIIFSGLAGAVLGLSTLSFYGRPQDRLSNIAIGAAIGVIGGATFTTYKAATDPYQTLDIGHLQHHLSRPKQVSQLTPTHGVSYEWSF